MNWYYAAQGQQHGPVTEAQLDEMYRNGTIPADALVWHDGMAGWEPYQAVRGGGVPPPIAGSTGSVGEPQPEAVCNECGRVLPVDETIAYGNVRVCAACKPAFLQKLKEGVSLPTGDLDYAPNGTRVGAYILDGIILFAFNMGVGFIMGLLTAVGARSGSVSATQLLPILLFCFQILVAVCYEGFMVGKYGGTLGKLALKIKVVNADGSPVSYGRAFGRYFAKLLSAFTCLIGFIIAFFDKEKRALHDRICNTRVVMK
jgi:uncharacterized RDD family membrane protein YckC